MNDHDWEQIDYLSLAKGLIRNATEDPAVDKVGTAQVAQAAATIALVERMERIAVVLEGVYDPNVEMLRIEAWNYDTRRELG